MTLSHACFCNKMIEQKQSKKWPLTLQARRFLVCINLISQSVLVYLIGVYICFHGWVNSVDVPK